MNPMQMRAIAAAEQEVARRLAVLIDLAKKSTPFEQIRAGYQEVVTSIERKYAVYLGELADRGLEPIQQRAEEARLQKRYLHEVSSIAVIIDRIQGI